MSDLTALAKAQLEKELERLRVEYRAAMTTIDRLLKDLSQKNEKLKHMESLVSQNVPVIKKNRDKITISAPSEQEIAETQLERLRQSSQTRALTLEEIRAYDLLVKNKRLSQDESTINLSKSNYRDVTNDTLLQLASSEVQVTDESDEK